MDILGHVLCEIENKGSKSLRNAGPRAHRGLFLLSPHPRGDLNEGVAFGVQGGAKRGAKGGAGGHWGWEMGSIKSS